MKRKWLTEDNAEIAKLEAECFSTPWTKGMLDGSVNSANFYGLVEEEEGSIVAYVGSSFDFWEAEVLLVCVKPSHRRRGIAEGLLKDIISHYKKLNKETIFLEVAESNAAAQALYFKLGFKKIAVREKYYDDTEDAFVLALSLKEI